MRVVIRLFTMKLNDNLEKKKSQLESAANLHIGMRGGITANQLQAFGGRPSAVQDDQICACCGPGQTSAQAPGGTSD